MSTTHQSMASFLGPSGPLVRWMLPAGIRTVAGRALFAATVLSVLLGVLATLALLATCHALLLPLWLDVPELAVVSWALPAVPAAAWLFIALIDACLWVAGAPGIEPAHWTRQPSSSVDFARARRS